ncbi:hypothetical protein GC093_22100 [Paenibacillus sp. LMG 31456]|uniref:Ferric siderophore reductase C-terminal domain-containing protein n=1 Tax=Paenibacillus foliorum TaxID=2654974 RepID=A0A972GZR8_9BACL|nr:(2Fe-2S)-binding protein [Paenibacillus foliorum]NOU95895.1 hypothetical protein [Paenibacillus foliorum]
MNNRMDYAFLDKQYNFMTKEHPQSVLLASLADLLDEEKAKRLIQAVMLIIRADKPDIAAYHMSSWFGMVCSAVQASLSLYDTVLLLSPDRLKLQIIMVEGRRKVSFVLRDAVSADMSIETSGASRSEVLNSFYEQTVRPIMGGLALASLTKENQLWAQFATRLYNEKDILLQKASLLPERRPVIEQDFAILLNELNVEKLGLKRNPFDLEFHWIEHMQHPDELIRQKVACCLAYKTDTSHGYCYTCPRLSVEGRQAKREA